MVGDKYAWSSLHFPSGKTVCTSSFLNAHNLNLNSLYHVATGCTKKTPQRTFNGIFLLKPKLAWQHTYQRGNVNDVVPLFCPSREKKTLVCLETKHNSCLFGGQLTRIKIASVYMREGRQQTWFKTAPERRKRWDGVKDEGTEVEGERRRRRCVDT